MTEAAKASELSRQLGVPVHHSQVGLFVVLHADKAFEQLFPSTPPLRIRAPRDLTLQYCILVAFVEFRSTSTALPLQFHLEKYLFCIPV